MKVRWYTILVLIVMMYGSVFVFVPGAQLIAKRPVHIWQVPETDTEVVILGTKIVKLIQSGHTVIYNGQPISLEEAEEMADY
jgi:hypothetical protein